MGSSHSKMIKVEDKAMIPTRELVDLLLRLRFYEVSRLITDLKQVRNDIDDDSYNGNIDWNICGALLDTCNKIEHLEETLISLRNSLMNVYKVLEKNSSYENSI